MMKLDSLKPDKEVADKKIHEKKEPKCTMIINLLFCIILIFIATTDWPQIHVSSFYLFFSVILSVVSLYCFLNYKEITRTIETLLIIVMVVCAVILAINHNSYMTVSWGETLLKEAKMNDHGVVEVEVESREVAEKLARHLYYDYKGKDNGIIFLRNISLWKPLEEALKERIGTGILSWPNQKGDLIFFSYNKKKIIKIPKKEEG